VPQHRERYRRSEPFLAGLVLTGGLLTEWVVLKNVLTVQRCCSWEGGALHSLTTVHLIRGRHEFLIYRLLKNTPVLNSDITSKLC
jgi:hypothetical protein